MRRLALAFVVTGLLVAAAATPAAATTTRIPVSTAPQTMTVLVPGTISMNGTVMSVRGMVAREVGNWHNRYVDGPAINTIDYDLDLATGAGEMWGAGQHWPTAVPDGGWDCHFHAFFADFAGSRPAVGMEHHACRTAGAWAPSLKAVQPWRRRAPGRSSWRPSSRELQRIRRWFADG